MLDSRKLFNPLGDIYLPESRFWKVICVSGSKMHEFFMRIPVPLYNRLKQYAALKGISLAEAARRLLDEALEDKLERAEVAAQ